MPAETRPLSTRSVSDLFLRSSSYSSSTGTSYLDLIEDLFLRHGIRSLRYDGKMGREAREMTLKQFREPGGPKVICISIKCGGVGLNLVSANRVINLDLSWNYATESQAYDRVHRMGQEKDVTIKRLVIKDTLEERYGLKLLFSCRRLHDDVPQYAPSSGPQNEPIRCCAG